MQLAMYDGKDHEHEAHEAYKGSYYDTACAEDIGLEVSLGRTGSCHQQQTGNDYDNTNCNENKVQLVKSKFLFHIF